MIFTNNDAVDERIHGILATCGWRCEREEDRFKLVERAESLPIHAILIDGAMPDAAPLVDALRQAMPPANGIPVIVIGGDEPLSPSGPGGWIDAAASDDVLAALLLRWAGPLEDHRLRASPFGPRYGLIRLLGHDAADGMLQRFRDALAEALEISAADPEAVPAHRLAGIAGMMGYTTLSSLWSKADRGEAGALEIALQASRRTLAEDFS